MRVQIASDLHLEYVQRCFPQERVISPAADADLLVLAGDISSGLGAFQTFANWPVPVLYVPGNHEFYWTHHLQTLDAMQSSDYHGAVMLLNRTEADFRQFEHWYARHRDELARIRFLGTTLWTDYRLPGLNRTQRQQMEAAQLNIADHRVIATDDGLFSTAHALKEHEQDRAWLEHQLATPFDGKTVVVTHHGPTKHSTHSRWAGNAVNGAFMSHFPELVEKADLWIHGHVHDSFDYLTGKCRVIANPRGYGMNLRSVERFKDIVWENQAFQHACVVEI